MPDWDMLGYVKASEYRKRILLALRSVNKTPNELRNELDLYITHISTTLKDLAKHGLVVCLTPKLRKGRLYSISDSGKELLPFLHSKADT